MTTDNKDAAVAAAAALLAKIESLAKQVNKPTQVKRLAEAYALVAGADTDKPGRTASF